jgi:type IV pilus assembly protein PilM
MNLNGILYRDRPMFGLDIGHGKMKAMQVDKQPGKPAVVTGYGISRFEPGAVTNGEIVKPEVLAEAAHELFEKNLVGNITSARVACALPTAHTFSRPMSLPPMSHHDIIEAIHLEAGQYIPVPLDNLYLDYEISHQDEHGIELLLVATSRKIVDSYLNLLKALSLEPVAFEPSINAASRLLKISGDSNSEPSILVDIGSVTTDIAVFDGTMLVSSTVNSGGDNLTDLLSSRLHLNYQQAIDLKTEYGISYSEKQQRVVDAIKPQLDSLVREIEKSIRYYSERASKSGKQIARVITVGGGAEMPGLNHFLSKELRLPCENFNPWDHITFGSLAPPSEPDRSMYITVAGEAILDPSEVSHD